MSHNGSPPPAHKPGLPRHQRIRRKQTDPPGRRRPRPPRPSAGRHGPLRLRKDHPPQLPQRPAQARLGPDLPQPRPPLQALEAEDLLRAAAGHLLPRADAAPDAGVHGQTEAAGHDEPLAEDAVRGPHHRRVGAAELPGHDYRGLHQAGAERW